MMKQKGLYLLKCVSYLAFFSFFYPIMLFFYSLFQKLDETADVFVPIDYRPFSPLISFLELLGFVVIAFFFSMLNQKVLKIKKVVLNNIFKLIVSLIAGECFFLLQSSLTDNFFLQGINSVIVVVAFFLGTRIYFYDYTEILYKTIAYLTIGLSIGSVIFCFVASKPFEINVICTINVFFFMVYIIQQNQTNIDNMMTRRRHSSSNLPKKIRQYNFAIAGGSSALILIALFCKEYIAKFMWWILDALRSFIAFLFSLLPKHEYGEEPGAVEQPPVGNGGAKPEAEADDPFWQYFYKILFIIVIVIFLIKVGPVIIKVLYEQLQNLKDKLYRFFHNKDVTKERTIESEYYTDFEEELERNTEALEKNGKERTYNKSKWKSDYKKYKGSPSSEEKVIFGYNLIVKWSNIQSIPIEKCDTPNEIMEKFNQSEDYNKIDLSTATQIFNLIKYGERKHTEQEITDLTATLDILKQNI